MFPLRRLQASQARQFSDTRFPGTRASQALPPNSDEYVSAHNPPPPHSSHRPTPTVTRNPDEPATDLQRWNGESVTPFLRWAFAVTDSRGTAHPNHNYDPDMNNAIRISETIDAFDRDPRMIQELILRISNPTLGHASMDWIRQNSSLVEMLLYRHYQRYGGLVLPPMARAVEVMRGHEDAVFAAQYVGAHPDEYPRVAFPPWRGRSAS